MLSLAIGVSNPQVIGSLIDDEGLAVTGVLASAMPTLSWAKAGGVVSIISLSDLVAADSAWTPGGVIHLGGGRYRLNLPVELVAAEGIYEVWGEEAGKHFICPPIQVGLQDAITTALVGAATQPYSSHAPQRVVGTKLTAFLGEDSDVSITVTCYDADKNLLDLTGRSLALYVAAASDPDTPLAPPQEFTGSGSTFDLTLNLAFTAAEAIDGQAHFWSLRDGTEVVQHGRLEVKKTARSA